MPWSSGYSEGLWMRLSEDLVLDKLLRSLRCIITVWSVLLEVLFLSPEQLEQMKKALKEETVRQRAEYEFLSRYR